MDIDLHSVTKLEHLNSYEIADSFPLWRYTARHKFWPTFHGSFFLFLLLYAILFGKQEYFVETKNSKVYCPNKQKQS